MDSKIENVLKQIEEQEKFEQENPDQVHHSEKVLAIGRNTGIFYNILLKGMKAQKILEIGMSVGYSTIWFAEAISQNPDSKIITIDKDSKKIERAQKNFQDSGVSDLIEIRKGDALNILAEIKNSDQREFLDFVFLDADKERFIEYFDAVLPLVKRGGMIAADNILFPERFRKFSYPYLEYVRQNPSIRSITIPIDNGEEISLKL